MTLCDDDDFEGIEVNELVINCILWWFYIKKKVNGHDSQKSMYEEEKQVSHFDWDFEGRYKIGDLYRLYCYVINNQN